MEEFQFPEDLSALTDAQLDEIAEAARAEGQRLVGLGTDITDEQLDTLERIGVLVDEQIPAVQTERETAVAERQQRLDAAAQRLEGNNEDDGGDGDEEEPAEEPAPVEEPAEEESLAASATRRRTTRVPSRTPANPTPTESSESGFLSIVASANLGSVDGVGAVTVGQDVPDMPTLARVFRGAGRKFDGLPAVAGIYEKLPVASLRRNFERTKDALYVGNKDYGTAQDVLVAAARESRLDGGSLVAAGGWCAPSENRYDLCQQETLDGILDLPEIGVPRGGINYTPGPSFADIYTDAGFFQTEAQAIAGETKACVEIDCPDFDEVRLDAVGICVKAPLLTRTAYPEAVQRWLEGTVVANQHKVSARLITAMRTALGTALAPTLTGTPVAWSTLSIVEWIIEMQRQAHRLSESESLEVVFPRWFKAVLRADFANRNGMVAAQRVTDDMMRQHFADRGAMVQFVLNYLEVATPLTSVAYPATVEGMIYPAGTFVKGTQDVISLDAIYDTADLVTNTYTAAFAEDGVLLAKMCHGGARVTIPVHVTGQLGAADIDQTLFTAQVNADG